MGEFSRKAESAYQILRTINADLREVDGANSTRSFKIERRISQKLEELNVKIQDLYDLLKIQANTPGEQKRRESILREIEENHDANSRKLRNIRNKTSVEMMPTIRRDGGYEKLSENELIQKQFQMKEEQDQRIDLIYENVNNLKKSSKDIGDELDLHGVLLEEVEKGVEKNTIKMTRAQKRMVNLIEQSSDCCLISTILILFAILLFIILYL